MTRPKNISTEMETAVDIKSTELSDIPALGTTFSVDSSGGSARAEEIEDVAEEEKDGAISVTEVNLN
jgi:hypothetical protein